MAGVELVTLREAARRLGIDAASFDCRLAAVGIPTGGNRCHKTSLG